MSPSCSIRVLLYIKGKNEISEALDGKTPVLSDS